MIIALVPLSVSPPLISLPYESRAKSGSESEDCTLELNPLTSQRLQVGT